MKLYRKITPEGFYLEDILLQNPLTDSETSLPDPLFISEPVPGGFYHPKWNFTTLKWEEGLTQEEIDLMLSIQEENKTQTQEERIQQLEEYILQLEFEKAMALEGGI